VLVGLRFFGDQIPTSGTEMQAVEPAPSGPAVGAITSVAYSPRLRGALALGYVRRGHTQVGTKLNSIAGHVEVVALPL
jgi:glycine cleavage system aminomethyltransferase T